MCHYIIYTVNVHIGQRQPRNGPQHSSADGTKQRLDESTKCGANTMYGPKKWTLDECRNELNYIKSVNPKRPGKSFNHDPDCFAEYCNMQANTMLHSGYRLLAHECTQSRDIAKPMYRSTMARVYGNETIGLFSFSPGIWEELRASMRNGLA